MSVGLTDPRNQLFLYGVELAWVSLGHRWGKIPTSLILRLPADLPTAHSGHHDEKSRLLSCCDISQLGPPLLSPISSQTVLGDFEVKTNSLPWLDIFHIWSACDHQEHVIPFKKQEERGKVRKRKEEGGPLFFKNKMKQQQPYLLSWTGHTQSCGFVTVPCLVALWPLETGPSGVMHCWSPQSRLAVPGSVAQNRPAETPRKGLPG